jgi:hypothetical protein
MAGAWKRLAALQALRRELGLKWYGGAPRKMGRVLTMAEEAKRSLEVEARALEARLPADVMTAPIEGLPAAAALGRAALSGIYQLIRIVEQPLDLADLKQQRLIGDMALGASKLLARAAEGEFRARKSNAIEELLAQISLENRENAKKG